MNKTMIIIDIEQLDGNMTTPAILRDSVGQYVAIRNVRGKYIWGKIYKNIISLGTSSLLQYDSVNAISESNPCIDEYGLVIEC